MQITLSTYDLFRKPPAGEAPTDADVLRRWLRRGGEPAELLRITNSFPAAKPAILHALQVLL
jgi:hypothetical protein